MADCEGHREMYSYGPWVTGGVCKRKNTVSEEDCFRETPVVHLLESNHPAAMTLPLRFQHAGTGANRRREKSMVQGEAHLHQIFFLWLSLNYTETTASGLRQVCFPFPNSFIS